MCDYLHMKTPVFGLLSFKVSY